MYNLACAYSLMKNAKYGNYYLRLAFQHGFDKPDKLESDADLEFLRDTDDFKKLAAEVKSKE